MRPLLRILRLRAMLRQGLATELTAGRTRAGLEMNWQKGGEGWEGSGGGWLARGADACSASCLTFVRPSDASLTNAIDQLPNPV